VKLVRARQVALGATLAFCVAGLVAPVPGVGAAPTGIEVMTVFRSGAASAMTVGPQGVQVRVGKKSCAVPARSPLAALVRSRPGAIGLKDFGSCSRRAGDAGGLFVRSVRFQRNRGQNGWVYKVGHTLATAGAGDPAGPFGRGRLRAGQRVTWFYCVYRSGCQRTIGLRVRSEGGGLLSVRVRGHDDTGRGVAVQGVGVRAGGVSATTDGSGTARLSLAPGRYTIRASKPGLVRSFGERVTVLP